MNNEYDDRFIDTDTDIHVPDYDPNLGAGQTPSPSADGNLNYYQRMQQGYNNGYPQDGYNSGRPQDSYNNGYPQDGYSSGYPQNGYNSGYPQDGYSSGYPQNGYNSGYPQDGYNSGYPQDGYNNGYPQNAYNNGLPQNGYNNGYPQNGYNNGRPQNAYADGYPENDPSAYADDEEYRRVHEGDDYDFGFAPRKKKKKTKPQRPSRERNNYEDEESYEDRRPPRKEKRRKSHPFLRLLRTVLILAVILGGIGWFFLHMAFSKLDRVDPVANTAANRVTKAAGVTPYRENGVINILLIGQDARNGETQTRSDTMIICSLNRKTGKITLASLMRDMYVSIPGYDSEKLNAAYAYGGMELLDETIQIDFGINIDGNAVVDFDGFLTALTSVGNIEIELSQEEADYLNVNPALGENNDYIEGVLWNLTPGVNSLTPKQALAYSRMRYVGNSDWDRTTRQKKVIQAVFSKVKHNPVQLIRTMNAAAPSIKTDMSDSTLIRACLYAMLCGSDMKTALIPGEGMYYADNINGMAVLVPDLDACHQALLDYLYNGGSSIGTVNEQITDNTVQPTANDNNSSGTPDTSEWPDLDGDGIGDVDEDHDGIPDSWGDVW